MALRAHLRILVVATVVAIAASVLAPFAPAQPAEAHEVQRIAGSNRYATAVQVSQRTPYESRTVFLASGEGFADALAAGPVAAAEQARLLLTARGHVPQVVLEELARLSPVTPIPIVLVGGEASISDAVRQQLADAGHQVDRIAGVDRVDTSMRLLDRLRSSGPVSEIWVVSGWSFADALVAGSVAGRNRGAIVLSYHGSSEADLLRWIDRVRPAYQGIGVNIAGGWPSVSQAAADWIRGTGAAGVWRYAGENRYDTARRIHDQFSQQTWNGTMLLATGESFPDAMAASVLAAYGHTPLYLAPRACNTEVAAMLRTERDERAIHTVFALGDDSALGLHATAMLDCPILAPAPSPIRPRP
ncbi:cell wall-binding repeat-containing protein [Agrococcus jejuensis]|uniref:Putative cell wall binding repeat 2 n=1 Tax=Agrococcus jejuensis TaxID=399736 RepID=A0A1G8GNN4_9MICO|nr:cell wall-binding repeat-containing protein [Agrococcus jejuensis]SDH95921.1 Putative cell wall binding repeat 2 [Agrococcus jejuensis]